MENFNAPPGYKLRLLTPSDTPAVWSLIGAVYQEYGLTLNVEADEPHLVEPGAYFRAAGGEFWVLTDEGEAIRATVAVKFLDDARAELKSLYVHPDSRKRGLGRELVNLVEDYARRAGKSELILWSDTRFVAAHGLYRSMDYDECGERDLHDTNDSIEFGFRKLLDRTTQPKPDTMP